MVPRTVLGEVLGFVFLNTLEYLENWVGICSVVGLGAVLAANPVLVVILAWIARLSYLVKLWLYRKASIVLRSYGLTASPGPLGRLGVPMITCCQLGGNDLTL